MRGYSNDIVILCQVGARITDKARYGALRATVEMAKQLKSLGRDVLLVGLGEKTTGVVEGVDFAALPTESEINRYIRLLPAIHCLIGVSRGDVLLMTNASKCLVYHHGAHPPEVIDRATLRFAGIPMICVSEASKREQIRHGFDPSKIHVVRNGYDRAVFFEAAHVVRESRSLFFAGSLIPYKGVDIALQAFRLLKMRFPDAAFHICGRQHGWSCDGKGGIPQSWLTSEGFLNWAVIEWELPGVKYHGELSQPQVADLLRRSSLLVMCSRVSEPCPLIVLEAQACGCVPVIPNIGGAPEIVAKEVSGNLYSVPPTPQVLHDQIKAIWERNDPSPGQRVAVRRWAQGFRWEEAGRQFNAILDMVDPVCPWTRPVLIISASCHAAISRGVSCAMTGWWVLMRWSSPLRHVLKLYRSGCMRKTD